MAAPDRHSRSIGPPTPASLTIPTPATEPDPGSLRAALRPLVRVAVLAIASGCVVVAHDVVVAAWFGASAAVDAYQLASSFPTVAINVFAGGTLLASLVPRLVQLDASGHGGAIVAVVHGVRRSMARLLAVVSIVWAAGFPVMARSIAQLGGEQLVLASTLSVLHLLALVAAGTAWVDVALQNSRRRFWLPSAAPAFLPAGAVTIVLFLGDQLGIMAASVGTLAGALLFLVVARASAGSLPPAEVDHDGAKRHGLTGDYWASAGAAALLGGILMTDTWVASTLPTGSTATYGFATRPVVLGLAFATTIVGNVLLPTFARLVTNGQFARARRQFVVVSSLLVVAALPVVGGVLFAAQAVVALLYERGSFGPGETSRVAAVMSVYVLQIPFFLVAMLGWRLLNSLRRNGVLLAVTAVAFGLNLALDLWLATTSGLVGIAWGTNWSFMTLATLIVLYAGLYRPSGKAAEAPAKSL